MRNNDEFNFVKVTNDEQLNASEFSFTPRDEASSYKDNRSTVTRDEVNDQNVSNSENKKQEEQQRRRENKDNNTESNRDNVGRVESTSAGSESSSSSSGSSSSSVSSASGAAASGSTAASTVGGTVVAAATVAVTAIAVVAGVNVIGSQNARVNIDFFSVQQTEVIYGLQLFTDKEDIGNYSISVTNPAYSASQPLQKGPDEGQSSDWPDFDPATEGWYNEGSFTSLTPETRYDVTIKDSGIGGKVLYESSFTTPAKPNNSFNGVNFGNPDYMTDEFTVTLDYVEEEVGHFSNFGITISNGTSTPLQVLLSATTEPQTLSSEDFNLMTDSFTYTLEYKEGTEAKIDEGSFDFNEGGTMKSELNSVTVGPDANYTNNTFSVNADFTDDFNVIDEVSLTFFDALSGEPGYTFPIEKGMNNNVSVIAEDEVQLDLTGGPYNYRINYRVKGDLYQEPASFEDQTPVYFVDTSSSAYFSDITFSNPDYQGNGFDVKLDYTEVLEGTFQDFNLTISNGSTETSIELDNTTEIQPVGLSQVPEFDLNEDDYTYTLTYSNGHTAGSYEGNFSFKDQAQSVFNGVSIDKNINFDTGEFLITLDVYNDLGLLSNFTFTLVEFDSKEEICTENLLPVRTEQTVTVPDPTGDLARTDYTYVVTYQDDGVAKTYNPNDTNPNYYFEFEISPDQEPLLSVDINEKADFVNNVLHVTLNYTDPYDFIGPSGIYLRIDIGDDGVHEFNLSKTNGVVQDKPVNFNLADYPTFSYDVDYTIPSKSKHTESQQMTVVDETIPEVNGLNTDFKMYQRTEGTTSVQTVYKMAFQVDYVDDYSVYTGFTLEAKASSDTYTKTLSMDHGWQYVTFSEEERDFIFNNSLDVTFTIKAARTVGADTIYDEFSTDPTQLTDGGTGSVIHAAWFDEYVVNGGIIGLSYLIYDNTSTFSDYSLTFVDTNDNSHQFSMQISITTADTALSTNVTLSSDILSLLESSSVTVALSYRVSGSLDSIVICTNVQFTVNN